LAGLRIVRLLFTCMLPRPTTNALLEGSALWFYDWLH